jgi:hypothetical protein
MTPNSSSAAALYHPSTERPVRLVRLRRFLSCAVLALALILPTGVQAQTISNYIAELEPGFDAPATTPRGRITLQVNRRDETLRFELSVTGVGRIVGSHLHRVRSKITSDGTRIYLDPSEGEGRTIAYFLNFTSEGVPGNGVVAKGVIRKSDLIGDLSERPFADLMGHLDAGRLYATVHSLAERDSGVFCCPIALRGVFRPAGAN